MEGKDSKDRFEVVMEESNIKKDFSAKGDGKIAVPFPPSQKFHFST